MGLLSAKMLHVFLSKMLSNILQNVNNKDINTTGHSDIARKLISYHTVLFALNP